MTRDWRKAAMFNYHGGPLGRPDEDSDGSRFTVTDAPPNPGSRDDGTAPIVQAIIGWSILLTVAFFLGAILTIMFAAIAEWLLLNWKW